MKLEKTGRISSEDNRTTNNVTIILFVIYLLAIFWILLLKLGVRFSYMGNRSVNLIAFNHPDRGELISNVVIFIPLGMYAGVLFTRWTFGTKLLLIFLTSSVVETLQFIFKIGAFDITDIITNMSGGIIGLIIFGAINKGFNDHVKAQRFVNIVAGIGTVLMISLLLLLKMNMLPVRYQ
ncbi:MAG TPA: VanZ family protein [Parafilimonas sp.]|nr:VanZ family protein [Parafilimonas sp.]